MNSHIDALPAWAALVIAFFLILGASLALLGNIGLVRFRSFYERLHAPTLGTSWGTGSIVIASMLMFSLLNERPVMHELIIAIFVLLTTPVTLMLLGRAALRRDRARGLQINEIVCNDPHALTGDTKDIRDLPGAEVTAASPAETGPEPAAARPDQPDR